MKLSCKTDASGHWCQSHEQAYLVCVKHYIAKLEAVAEAARAALSYGWRKGPVDPMTIGGKYGTLERCLLDVGIKVDHAGTGA